MMNSGGEPLPQKSRILILTADAGFGHRSAANAIAQTLEMVYGELCVVELVNPLDDRRTPFFLRDSQSDYDKLVKRLPELYRIGYDASDARAPVVIAEQALIVLMFDVLRDLLRNFRPDVIVSTYPFYMAPLRAVLTITRQVVPLISVVTDLANVHRVWFNNSVDMLMVPTQIVYDQAVNHGVAPDQVHVTGIPVNPLIAREERSPAQIRTEMGLEPDLMTVLAVGSRRVERLLDSLEVLNHFGRPLQLMVVAGKDEKLYRNLQAVDWHVPTRLMEYVTNVPALMKAAEWVICKAGGLVVTEALACGRPMMLVDVLPGQETGNADYVVENGAGELTLSSQEVLETTAHWLMEDGRLLHERTENAVRLGRPGAAYEIANAAWVAAQGRVIRPRPGTGRLRLIDLLTRNQVHWEDDGS